jgi:hypothetical protein
MAILKNTTISGNNYLQIGRGNTSSTRTIDQNTVVSFTSTGTTSWIAPAGVTSVEVLVVAGGGGGGAVRSSTSFAAGAGGGSGGLLYNPSFSVTPGVSYTVTVGAGGAGSATGVDRGTAGGNSVFATLTAIGGGGGASWGSPGITGGNGGSGGGGSGSGNPAGGTGTAGQGYNGGTGTGSVPNYGGGGGGGAGGPGGNGTAYSGGGGGPGLAISITGTPVWYGGGGGGGSYTSSNGAVGNGGIGGGGSAGQTYPSNGSSATANTGGGGGGATSNGTNVTNTGGAGGSGIVVLRYSLNSSSTSPIAEAFYNTDLDALQVYEGTSTSWISTNLEINLAGHNLLTRSQTFLSPWATVNSSLVNNAGTAPDNTNTATKLTELSTSSNHGLIANVLVITGQRYVFSIFAKAAEKSILAIRADNQNNWNYFDLSTGLLGSTSTLNSTSVSIIKYNNGWYRCVFSYIPSGTGNDPEIYIAKSDGVTSGAGTLGSGIFIWGAQLETNVTSPGPYTPTTDLISLSPSNFGRYRIHRFTDLGSTTFVPANSGTVEVLVVAGGGGGGGGVNYSANGAANTGGGAGGNGGHGPGGGGGGGGGGGVIYRKDYSVIAGEIYTVTVGDGGTANANATGNSGQNSRFGNLVAIGGGGGSSYTAGNCRSGGSGGGGDGVAGAPGYGGPGTFGQGFAGGNAKNYSPPNYPGAGGGGAGGPGSDSQTSVRGGDGGPGRSFDITGTYAYYGGGGGGGGGVGGLGGVGGGTAGAPSSTGSGKGGSGIVVVRYKTY